MLDFNASVDVYAKKMTYQLLRGFFIRISSAIS